MKIGNILKKRKERSKYEDAATVDRIKMVQEFGNGFYTWNGKLYKSDIVMACIRPYAKAIGKAAAKHIRETMEGEKRRIRTNPEPYIRFLLEEPNPYMCGQVMQEKIANQLALNNNAFLLIIRDENGIAAELYPIPCAGAEIKYKDNDLYIKFTYQNGKQSTFPYSDIVHIRNDYINNDIFGENPRETLAGLMECVGVIDQGIVKAIKNSNIITWLLKFTQSLRPEDLKSNVKAFVDNYLAFETETFGAAGVDSKVDAQRIEPKDYVPNALQTKNIIERIYAFFNTNEKIVHSNYTEDEWISYYEGVIEPVLMQMSNEYTRKLFTRRERGFGNQIIFESSSLTFASMNTKLQLVQYVDRGIMTPNEVRRYMNMAPLDGGDEPLLRKDTGKLTKGGEEDEKSRDQRDDRIK